MKNIAIFCLVILICSSCSDHEGLICVEGSGTTNDYPITLTSFDEVALFGPVNLRIAQGPAQEVFVTAEPELFEYLEHEVNNGRLEIGIKENIECYETEFGIWINMTVPDLEAIFVVGASEIESSGDLDLDKLLLDVVGAANVTLTGNAEEMVIDVNGQAFLTNFDLITDQTRIDINGMGTMEITCESILDIRVSGSATIRYKGNPAISQNGLGSIILINSN